VRLESTSQSPAVGIHHVVAGLLVDADKVLLCHRSAGRRWCPSLWDLPGGHVEKNEAPSIALVRELHEELGIVVPEPTDLAFAHLQQTDFACRIWVIREWIGIPHIESNEHDDMGWVDSRGNQGTWLLLLRATGQSSDELSRASRDEGARIRPISEAHSGRQCDRRLLRDQRNPPFPTYRRGTESGLPTPTRRATLPDAGSVRSMQSLHQLGAGALPQRAAKCRLRGCGLQKG
jgi:8-oxo-dGTP diphosphatase